MNGKIEDYIPVGYENRIPRWLLRDRTGLTDRMMRLEISRSPLPIVWADEGYFIPENTPTDIKHTQEYVSQERSRALSILRKMKKYGVIING